LGLVDASACGWVCLLSGVVAGVVSMF